jgi:hypothetical protein
VQASNNRNCENITHTHPHTQTHIQAHTSGPGGPTTMLEAPGSPLGHVVCPARIEPMGPVGPCTPGVPSAPFPPSRPGGPGGLHTEERNFKKKRKGLLECRKNKLLCSLCSLFLSLSLSLSLSLYTHTHKQTNKQTNKHKGSSAFPDPLSLPDNCAVRAGRASGADGADRAWQRGVHTIAAIIARSAYREL